MSTGYIKIYRSLKQSAFYKDSQYVHLWLHLLMSVNRTEKRLKIEKTNTFVDLHPGQVLTSRQSLVQQTGIHRSKVERILKAFESEQQIEQQTFSKYRIISISKWQQYQCGEHENEQQTSNKRATNEQQVSTNKKEEKEKKEPLLRVSDIVAMYQRYAGVNQCGGGQIPIFQDLIAKYTKEAIEEAFQAAAGANIQTAGFLSWARRRLERKPDDPANQKAPTGSSGSPREYPNEEQAARIREALANGN